MEQAWEEERRENVMDSVQDRLQKLVSSCSKSNEETWPKMISQHFDLLATGCENTSRSNIGVAKEHDHLQWYFSAAEHYLLCTAALTIFSVLSL